METMSGSVEKSFDTPMCSTEFFLQTTNKGGESIIQCSKCSFKMMTCTVYRPQHKQVMQAGSNVYASASAAYTMASMRTAEYWKKGCCRVWTFPYEGNHIEHDHEETQELAAFSGHPGQDR